MPAGSGPRYIDWTHVHIRGGDKAAAAAYVPAARGLLGYVMGEAKRLNLGVYKAKRVLRDGTVIVAEKIGDIPRMTIYPVGGDKFKDIRTLEGFFFTRFDVDTRPVLLSPSVDDDETTWTSYFYSSSEAGYEETPEEQRGTYIDVFGTKTKQPWKRMATSGGIWMDRETKEAVTWFRGYLAYWPQHYRHPATNYAGTVSIYGHEVYTVPDSAWRVLAAAKRDMWLYVLIADNLGALEPPERPAFASESGQMWFSQPFTDTAYTYTLWRYPLSIVTQPDTLIETYKAAPHSDAEELWQGELELAYGAWSFNADCTSVVTMQLPRRAIIKFHTELDAPSNRWEYSTDVWDDYPVVEAERIELIISHGIGTPSVTLNSEVEAETIAEEDGKVLKLVLAAHTADAELPAYTNYARLEYQCGDFIKTAYEAYREGPPSPTAHLSRDLVYAHLPTMTFLFLRKEFSGGDPETVDIRYELYVNGEEVATEDDAAFNGTISGGLYSDDTRMRLDVPWFGIVTPGGDWAMKVDIDSMTLLMAQLFTIRDAWGSLPIDGPNNQAYMFVTKPYVPMTIRLNAPSLPANFGGGVPDHAGAGGWSFSQYGGPGPTFAWESGNPNALGTYFNRGEYDDDAPNLNPVPCAFGSAMAYEDTFAAAVKLDVWPRAAGIGGFPSPYPYIDELYPYADAAGGDAKTLVEAITPEIADVDTLHYFAAGIGHTGAPMKDQQTRFAA